MGMILSIYNYIKRQLLKCTTRIRKKNTRDTGIVSDNPVVLQDNKINNEITETHTISEQKNDEEYDAKIENKQMKDNKHRNIKLDCEELDREDLDTVELDDIESDNIKTNHIESERKTTTESKHKTTCELQESELIKESYDSIQLDPITNLSEDMDLLINNLKVISEIKESEKLWLDSGTLSISAPTIWQPLSRRAFGQSRETIIPAVIEIITNATSSKNKNNHQIYNLYPKVIVGLTNLKISYPDKETELQILINLINNAIKCYVL